ncbi:hypothetical protein TorRG33x02_181120 [Trema orientale]|uniref:Uncharacterized protein n=2 Tax=Cannabaceae TaxID=3481 RepID=A0A2P5AEV1_PARAD|nr:hypothetical protein PanWU01x14_339300 [Parasponia andersonii]PON86062.1 hypothetical protein TorRG33x02_181120 [Trema orientale]
MDSKNVWAGWPVIAMRSQQNPMSYGDCASVQQLRSKVKVCKEGLRPKSNMPCSRLYASESRCTLRKALRRELQVGTFGCNPALSISPYQCQAFSILPDLPHKSTKRP